MGTNNQLEAKNKHVKAFLEFRKIDLMCRGQVKGQNFAPQSCLACPSDPASLIRTKIITNKQLDPKTSM